MLVVGGTIPSEDIPELKELGRGRGVHPRRAGPGDRGLHPRGRPGLAAGLGRAPASRVRRTRRPRARRRLLALADRLVPAAGGPVRPVGGDRPHADDRHPRRARRGRRAGQGPGHRRRAGGPAGRERRRASPRDARRLRSATLLRARSRAAASRSARTGQPLRSDHPHSVRDWARYFALKSNSAAWADLTETVRTGKAAFPRVHGRSVWQWFAEHPEEERVFAGGHARRHRAGRRRSSSTATRGRTRASSATWPAAWAPCSPRSSTSRPGLRGVLVDGPGVLAEADGWLAGRGLRDRVELSEGDIFRSLERRGRRLPAEEHPPRLGRRGLRHDPAAPFARPCPRASRLVVVEYLQERNAAGRRGLAAPTSR